MSSTEFHRSAVRVLRRLSHEEHRGMRAGLVLEPGDIVYEYGGYTYQCISAAGTAVTLQYDTPPFFEVPKDAIAPVESEGSGDAS